MVANPYRMRTMKPIRFAIVALILASIVLQANLSIRTMLGASKEETECQNLYFPRQQYKDWDKDQFPLLYSAVEHSITKETYVTLRPREYHVGQGEVSLDNATWMCNGKKVRDEPIKQADLHPEAFDELKALAIVCPPLDGPLNKIEIILSSGRRFEYNNLAHWWNCQVNHHPVTARLSQHHDTSKDQGKILSHIVVATIVKGAGPQAFLPQWVEYHRQVFGIGHIFVYVDEAWDIFSKRRSYREWEYVTYVPFAVNPITESFFSKKRKGYIPFFFQKKQQNDMLYRVKAFQLKGANTPLSNILVKENKTHSGSLEQKSFGSQVQWIGMFDIDEYLFVPPGATLPERTLSAQGDPSYRYAKYLDTLLGTYGPKSGLELAGVQFENVFYDKKNGKARMDDLVTRDGKTKGLLLCDYTDKSVAWKPTKEDIWARIKFFVRPDVALFPIVHNLVSPKVQDDGTSFKLTYKETRLLDPETELQAWLRWRGSSKYD